MNGVIFTINIVKYINYFMNLKSFFFLLMWPNGVAIMTVVFVYDIIPIRRFIQRDILVREQIEGREEITNSNTHIWFHFCLSNDRVGRR